MSVSQYKRYIWLLNLIHAQGRVTRDQIDSAWAIHPLNTGGESCIPRRTLTDTIAAIEEIFDVDIECDRHTNEYYIATGQVPQLPRSRVLRNIDMAGQMLHQGEQSSLPVQTILIDCILEEVPRLRQHPLHESQREERVTEDGVVFEYTMQPSLDWYESVRSLGSSVKILSPSWLVDFIREDLSYTYHMYDE